MPAGTRFTRLRLCAALNAENSFECVPVEGNPVEGRSRERHRRKGGFHVVDLAIKTTTSAQPVLCRFEAVEVIAA